MDATEEYAFGPFDDARDKRIAELEAAVEAQLDQVQHYRTEVERLSDLLRHISAPIRHDDRLPYVTVHIDNDIWEQIEAAIDRREE
jgi:hypothetical protein